MNGEKRVEHEGKFTKFAAVADMLVVLAVPSRGAYANTRDFGPLTPPTSVAISETHFGYGS